MLRFAFGQLLPNKRLLSLKIIRGKDSLQVVLADKLHLARCQVAGVAGANGGVGSKKGRVKEPTPSRLVASAMPWPC